MWWSTFVVCLCVIVGVSQCEDQISRIVKLTHGSIRGYKDANDDVFVFYNIPYATVPKGLQKFKGPLPPPAWLDTLEAVDEGVICPQAGLGLILPKDKVVKDDCLIANVYVPVTEEKNLPVVVYVHGGAFQLGFGDWIPLKNLVKGKMIAVTFNYRLGIHGFLCLGTENVPGNAGMKDQVALLKWVQRNIAKFGGNPKDVTVAGCSAGGASVDLLMLSKTTKYLFKKVIPESGANVAAFAVQPDPLADAKKYAEKLNFTNGDDVYALEDFYVNAPRELLTQDAFFDRVDSSFVFTPCVERDTGGEMFLDDSPVNILKSGNYRKLPMLYGFADMEGLLRLDFFDLWKHKMNERFSDFLPTDLQFENSDEKEEVANRIKTFYFGNNPVGDDNILQYINFFSDILFTYPALRAVQLHIEAGHNQIYLYEYSFVEESSDYIPHTNTRGATHCAQTVAVLDGENIFKKAEGSISEDYKNIKNIMRQLWTNFIKTGKPVPEGSELLQWPPVGPDWSPHMSLNRTMELRGSLLQKRVLFWDGIYKKHYRQPIPPPTPPIRHSEL